MAPSTGAQEGPRIGADKKVPSKRCLIDSFPQFRAVFRSFLQIQGSHSFSMSTQLTASFRNFLHLLGSCPQFAAT